MRMRHRKHQQRSRTRMCSARKLQAARVLLQPRRHHQNHIWLAASVSAPAFLSGSKPSFAYFSAAKPPADVAAHLPPTGAPYRPGRRRYLLRRQSRSLDWPDTRTRVCVSATSRLCRRVSRARRRPRQGDERCCPRRSLWMPLPRQLQPEREIRAVPLLLRCSHRQVPRVDSATPPPSPSEPQEAAAARRWEEIGGQTLQTAGLPKCVRLFSLKSGRITNSLT